MSGVFEKEFIEISLTVFLRITGPLPFDVHIKRGQESYTKLFNKGSAIDADRLADYQSKKGVESLCVHKNDYRAYLFYVEQVASKFFSNIDHTSTDDLANIVNEMVNLSMLEIVVHCNVDAKSLEHASTAIRGCLHLLSKDTKSLAKIIRYATRHPYTIKHSISTSIFAVMLGKAAKFESEKSLMTIGMGALLHDLGMGQLTFDAEGKAELTPTEWKEIKEHCQLGKRLVDSIKGISPEVKQIILQHHEQPNGMGYPNGLHDKDIFMLAKIVAIADSFSALISVRPYREEAFSPIKAIEIMNEDRGKFDGPLLDFFAKLFVSVK